jgi:DNA-binding PadR family transcriptional regulator
MEINKDLIAASSTPIVLAILAEEDSYGYAILQRVRELSGGRMEWTDGMLYPVLHRLERLGHVEARWEVAESGRRRKYYRITSRGRAQLAEERRQWQAVDATLRGIWQALSLPFRPATRRQPRHCHREPDDAGSRSRGIARGADRQWRSYLRRRQAIHSVDVAELEDHLREQVAVLVDAGLATDEAFLVAVKRMGDLDALSREFAREHSDRLWKQLVVVPSDSGEPRALARTDAIVAFCLAVAAALAIKVPALFGIQLEDQDAGFYTRNLSLFVLPLLTGYFVWKRRLDTSTLRWLAVAFVAAVVFANVYPFAPGGSTEALTALHLPIALWLVVGIAYAGGRWSQMGGRMDFIRFSGELFIYYVLIALGGGVLTAFMAMIFQAIGIDVEPFFESWLLPCGAVGAVVVASWLVEAKQSVIENMAPVLTRLFSPLFAAVLVTFLGTLLWTGRGVDIERDVLIAFDLLLVVVLGLLLYSVSARDPRSPPGAFDVVQVVLVVSALLADAVALWAIAARITEFGFSPNRVAALGENVILLVNLAWSAVLYIRFLRGRGSFTGLERWQTDYLPVYAVWAAIVVIVFPPVFGYV